LGVAPGFPAVGNGLGGLPSRRWTPAKLFAGARDGAWYDPSDLSTLFQERTAPITPSAVGGPVGTMLDKSQGLALGSELAVNGDFAASNPSDHLLDLIMAFKSVHLNNANWVTRRTVIAKIRKFKEATTNAYMWQPGLQAGQPSTLLGFPVVMAEDMPALATGSLSMALGNFQAYQIVDRLGIRVLRDPFTEKPYVKFYTTKRTGGGVLDFEAIKFIKFGS
jgi:HK97 family phage major capsid protein